jgi:hypothetical protein
VATTGRPVRHSRPRRCAPGAGARSRRRQAGSIAWLRGRGRGSSLAGSPGPNRAGPGAIWARLWGGDGWILRRKPGRTTLRPRSVSLFQESPGCPPGSGRPVAGPPGSSSAPGTTPNSSGDAPCHCPGPQGTVRRGFGDGRAARESRMRTPRMAGTTTSVQMDGCPCQSGYTVSVSPRRAGNAGMPWANADEEVGACRQQ